MKKSNSGIKDDRLYWVWLSSLTGIGSVRGRQLLDIFETPQNIWNARESDFKGTQFENMALMQTILNPTYKEMAEKHLQNAYKNKISVVTVFDDDYPFYLKNIFSPPLVLYIRGQIKKKAVCIAIVGSRAATDYGLQLSKKLAMELAALGMVVVSGMARGIDSYAHYGALKASGQTIAVLGCGVNVPYPPENESLMEQIAKNGAIISEYLPGTQAVSQNFPARNRIISGLSRGVVVVEATTVSGSLITANFALEQGREVFAIPGNIDCRKSRGTNKLIKDGAKIVTCVEDILEELSYSTLGVSSEEPKPRYLLDTWQTQLDEPSRKIADCLKDGKLQIDEISRKTAIMPHIINSRLTVMELNGLVEQLPGKIYKLRMIG